MVLFIFDKIFKVFLSKYKYFINLFFTNFLVKFLKFIQMNNYLINLVNNL